MMETNETLNGVVKNYETFKKDYKNNEFIDVGLACGVANSVGFLLETIEQQQKEIENQSEWISGLQNDRYYFNEKIERYEQALKQLNEYTMLEAMQDIIDEALNE